MTSAGHPSEPESRSVPKVCGGLVSAGVPSAPSHVRITGRKVSLSLLAAHLGEMGQFDRPILDRTDLKGTFDLALEWGPDPASGGDPGDRQINLLEALRDQLGLKLLRQTSSLNVLLIEHVDQQPTEN